MRTILSIDGGGIRGLIPALLLAELEKRLGRPTAHLFDFIAGTSTGGILALALACPNDKGEPRFRAEELVALYEQQGSKIFHRPAWRKFAPIANLFDEKYCSSGIESVLETYFGDKRLKDAVTPVIVTSYEIERRIPFFFKSWRARISPEYDWPMKVAARATSAAPTYFEPLRIDAGGTAGYYALVDGGLYANNPAMCAVADAKTLFGDEELLVLSLGTGSLTRPLPYEQARKWGVAGWAKPVLEVVFDGVSSSVDFQLRQLVPSSIDQPRYLRFQVVLDQGLQAMDDTSPSHLRRLKLLAEAEMRKQASELDGLVGLLHNHAIEMSRLRDREYRL